MIWLVRRLREDYRAWDRPTRLALGIGLVLLIVALIVAILAPHETKTLALIGAGAILVVMQIAVLWGNRGMVSVYTQAQRAYLNGDLEGAAALLEAFGGQRKPDARMLTLLGNTYRQLGRLDESAAVLYEAVDKAPESHFALTGFGRTLLAEGKYDEAADMLARALAVGAPTVVHIDHGEALFRAGRLNEARTALRRGKTDDDARRLLQSYLLFQLGDGEFPSLSLVETGLDYWLAAAERFRHTRYGGALNSDIQAWRKRAEG